MGFELWCSPRRPAESRRSCTPPNSTNSTTSPAGALNDHFELPASGRYALVRHSENPVLCERFEPAPSSWMECGKESWGTSCRTTWPSPGVTTTAGEPSQGRWGTGEMKPAKRRNKHRHHVDQGETDLMTALSRIEALFGVTAIVECRNPHVSDERAEALVRNTVAGPAAGYWEG